MSPKQGLGLKTRLALLAGLHGLRVQELRGSLSKTANILLPNGTLGRPLGYVIVSLMALIGDHIY